MAAISSAGRSVGEIALLLVRMETSQKAAKRLAAWIDERRAAAVKECRQ
jgi:hypothetical protein